MPKISIIVPIYNSEEYLKECLNSLVNQTFKDIEIICVNDGSTDNSLEIVKYFAEKDSRIKVINQENKGQSAARNAGLKIASGEWITFIDSDDYIDLNTYERALTVSNVDVICFGIEVYGDNLYATRQADNEYYKIKYKSLVHLNNKIRLNTDVSVCDKLFKKEIIDNYGIRFPEGIHFEDAEFYWKYILCCKSANYIDEYFYHYRRREDSIMHNAFHQKGIAIEHLYIIEHLYKFMVANELYKNNINLLIELFKQFFSFAYINTKPKNQFEVLGLANIYANKYFSDKKIKSNFIKALQKTKYNDIWVPDLKFYQKIFRIQKVYLPISKCKSKYVYILGLKIKLKNKIQESYNKITALNEIIKNQDKNIANLTKLVNEQYEYNHNQFNYFQNIEYETAYNIWISQGATLELCNRLSYLSQSEYQWNIQNNKLWLIYISCLVETKNNKKALDILNKYLKKWGLTDIDRFVLVSKFAKENNITSAQIEKTYFIYNYMNNIRNNNVIEELLKGKSVAIVGNGPSEIGKNKGKEIDSHDIVIRINNYVISGYENDYGTKTNIWVRGSGSPQVEDRTQHNEYLAVLWEADYEHFPIFFNHIDILYRDAKNNIIFSNFDFRIHKEIKEKSKINFPTSGLMCIYWLHSLKLKKLSYYGFSFLDGANKNIHYYKDEDEQLARNFIEPHSLAEETDFIRKVLNV